MTTNYPIIETQLRLIRALQKGYVEALEAGDWQAADYRAAHLHKLCEGLNHLSQLLDKGRTLPTTTTTPKNRDNWVSSIRAVPSTLSLDESLNSDNKPVAAPHSLPEYQPEPLNEEWHSSFHVPKPTSLDEAP